MKNENWHHVVRLLVVGSLVTACATLGRAAFNSRLNDCAANLDSCQSQCSSGGDLDLCDARYVIVAERGGGDAKSVASLDKNLERICARGIERACAARSTIKPALEAEAAGQNAEVQAASSRQGAAADDKTFKERARELGKQARELLAAVQKEDARFDRGPARYAAQYADQASRCSPRCPDLLALAETELTKAQAVVAAIHADKEAAQRAAEATKLLKEELRKNLERCTADAAACQTECASKAASNVCVTVAILLSAGDERLTKRGPDPRHARELAKKTCDAGNDTGCKFVEQLHADAGKCSDESACKRFCEDGFSDGCGQLGEMYASGNGVRKDAATAVSFFKKGCDLGLPGGCNAVGSAYFDGQGVARDRAAAQRYFHIACNGYQTLVDERTAQGKSAEMTLVQRDAACRNEFGTSCVVRVQAASQRRPALDQQCKRRGLPREAWATLNGTDTDDCMNAMMNRGCTEAMGMKAYCCPTGN